MINLAPRFEATPPRAGRFMNLKNERHLIDKRPRLSRDPNPDRFANATTHVVLFNQGLRQTIIPPNSKHVKITMSHKSVLITGCSEGGIGHTLALEWKSRDYRVFATARTLHSMTTLEQAGVYGASKSAAMYIADTLHFEMYPFNVKVLNICTGGVKSQIAKNATKNYNLSLPRDSVYLPIEEQFNAAQNNRLEEFIDTKEYA